MGAQSGEPAGFETTTTRLRDGSVVLKVVGEIDLDTAAQFKAGLDEAISRRDSRVIIDLTGCGFVDSTGLNVLVHADVHLNGSGPLILIVPQANILKVFEITHLDDQFVILPTLAQALEGES